MRVIKANMARQSGLGLLEVLHIGLRTLQTVAAMH